MTVTRHLFRNYVNAPKKQMTDSTLLYMHEVPKHNNLQLRFILTSKLELIQAF